MGCKGEFRVFSAEVLYIIQLASGWRGHSRAAVTAGQGVL